MKLTGAAGQAVQHFKFDASGTIVSATLPQLILPRRNGTSMLVVQNLHATATMFLEFGSARAVATITNGVVTSVSVTNAGFGFSKPPALSFRGGGASNFAGFLGATEPGSPPPSNVARGRCVMTGSAPNMSVASITVDYGGSGYLIAPYVQIENNRFDPNGCADPSVNGGSGVMLNPVGGSYYINGTSCPTDSMALFCATLGAPFTVKWMD